MKFNPCDWKEVKPHEKAVSQKGMLRVRCSIAAPLYIESFGAQALAGVATAFDLDLSEEVIWHFDAPKGARVFVFSPERAVRKVEGEVFTNIDRMPDESGSVAEVTRALRQFELERRAGLRELRAEREALAAERAAAAVEPLVETLADPASEVPL